MAGELKLLVQKLANRLGYQIRRREEGVSFDDAFSEQIRLAGPDARTVLEVGAADGRDSAAYAQALPKARVIVFEPLPTSFAKIEEHARANDRIVPVNAAVADKVGTAQFHVAKWEDASSLLPTTKTGTSYDEYHALDKVIEVPVTTLDSKCAELGVEQVDLLKMDAQGAELMILAGAADLLARRAIKLVYAEVHFSESYAGSGFYHDVAAALYAHGFELHSIYNIVHDQNGRMLWGDALFRLGAREAA